MSDKGHASFSLYGNDGLKYYMTVTPDDDTISLARTWQNMVELAGNMLGSGNYHIDRPLPQGAVSALSMTEKAINLTGDPSANLPTGPDGSPFVKPVVSYTLHGKPKDPKSWRVCLWAESGRWPQASIYVDTAYLLADGKPAISGKDIPGVELDFTDAARVMLPAQREDCEEFMFPLGEEMYVVEVDERSNAGQGEVKHRDDGRSMRRAVALMDRDGNEVRRGQPVGQERDNTSSLTGLPVSFEWEEEAVQWAVKNNGITREMGIEVLGRAVSQAMDQNMTGAETKALFVQMVTDRVTPKATNR